MTAVDPMDPAKVAQHSRSVITNALQMPQKDKAIRMSWMQICSQCVVQWSIAPLYSLRDRDAIIWQLELGREGLVERALQIHGHVAS